jgi:hypothetical protein
MVVMGVLAVRLQELGKVLLWDGPNMEFTNISNEDTIPWQGPEGIVVGEANQNERQQRKVRYAKPFSQELIKHTYREGWSLPAMP